MRNMVITVSIAALAFVGCGTSHPDRRVTYDEGSYMTEERPVVVVEEPHGDVVVETRGDRTYVREYDSHAGESRMQPRYRGKHPESLGWNDPSWYHR